MKEFFIDKKFSEEACKLLAQITVILEKYAAQGYDLSLRQLYYQLVAADLLPKKWADPKTGSTNNERSYKNIGSLVSDARLAGLIDWGMITDRGRVTIQPTHWKNPQEIIMAAVKGYRIDKWADQPVHVEVMVEKQALEGVLIPVCRELDINFTANKGYSSSSAMYEAGKRLAAKIADEKEVHIIYLGDHDPSGIDMTRDVLDRLQMFAETRTIEVHRVALNMEQIEELNPPENPAKMTDSRASDYVDKFGESSWELDAIEPRSLATIVKEKVRDLRDPDIWAESIQKEKKGLAILEAFAKKGNAK